MSEKEIIHLISNDDFFLSVCGVDWDSASTRIQDVTCEDCLRLAKEKVEEE